MINITYMLHLMQSEGEETSETIMACLRKAFSQRILLPVFAYSNRCLSLLYIYFGDSLQNQQNNRAAENNTIQEGAQTTKSYISNFTSLNFYIRFCNYDVRRCEASSNNNNTICGNAMQCNIPNLVTQCFHDSWTRPVDLTLDEML